MHAHPLTGRWFHIGWAWIAAALAALTVLAPGTAHADAGEYIITVDLGDWTHSVGSFQALTHAPTHVVGSDLEPLGLEPELATWVPLPCRRTEWTFTACDSGIEFTVTVDTPTLDEFTVSGQDPTPDDIAKAVQATFTIDGKDPVGIGKDWATWPCPAARPTVEVSRNGKSWPVPDWDLYPVDPCN
jgi:hypothetical protein